MARGDGRVKAQQLAAKLVYADADHWHPIFIERARELGLQVGALSDDRDWARLVIYAGWAR
jgi:hypothetical protein